MDNIHEAYEKVFNSDGTIKNCGREACSNLIRACNSLDPTKCFGDVKSGIMNITNIKSYYKILEND